MYPLSPGRVLLLASLALGACACCRATQRTQHQSGSQLTHSTHLHSSKRQQQVQTCDTLTLDLTEEVHPLPSFTPFTAPSPHEGRGWVAHYHLRQIAHRHSTGTDSLHERDTLRAMTRLTHHTTTSHKAPTSPLRPFAIGVSLLLFIGGIYTLLNRRTRR